VFIDFDTDFLLKLEPYDETGLPCVRRVARELFVRDALSLESAGGGGSNVPARPIRLVPPAEPVRARPAAPARTGGRRVPREHGA
jgi:hypothetical protein